MPEFNELQGRLHEAAEATDAGRRQLFLARERLRRIEQSLAATERTAGRDSDAWHSLQREHEQARQAITAATAGLNRTIAGRAGLLKDFGRFTDPRENIALLPDTDPILLFPVRIETRFRALRSEDGATRHQLWVRIFPDECSIDSFDDVLSESEVARARAYWTALWQAGEPADAGDAVVTAYVRDQRKAAWRRLMGTFNAGRAYWITGNYEPVSQARPQRAALSDRILVIPTDDLPPQPVRDALAAYWEAVLRAGDDQAAIDDAFTTLIAATGGDAGAAADLVARYEPANLDASPAEVVEHPAVTVAFLEFEPADTKQTAWSQAASVRTFPERFVLLGYQGNDAPPVIEQVGAPVPDPLFVGPDTRDDIEALLIEEHGPAFADLPDEEKATRYVEYLSKRAETRWLFDFDEAVALGLGFRVDISAAQARQGFTRLFVVGVRLGDDAQAGATALERLLHNHQFGDVGFGLLPQGTPTNNTEDAESGQSVHEDADAAYDRYFGDAVPDDPLEPARATDGRTLARLLGIDVDEAGLRTAPHYYSRDQVEARAMHTALWNATLGFFLESMAPPLLSDANRSLLRRHLRDHVRGRGALPAIRIGDQPYGILPISDLRNPRWLNRDPRITVRDVRPHFLQALYAVLNVMRDDWATLLSQVAHVGKAGDAHAILLQALGLHAGSVEFDRRIAQSFDQIRNALYAQGVLGDEIDNIDQAYRARGMQLLERLGYRHDTEANPEIPILTRSFLGAQEDVTKPLVDDAPLSEERRIRAYTEDDENYIEWLFRYATEDHERIRRQQGFIDNRPPGAILYDLLRHALNLEFGNASIGLHQQAGLLTAVEASAMRLDTSFIGVQVEGTRAESRWDLIYRQEPQIVQQGLVVEHISALLAGAVANDATNRLEEVLAALDTLKDVPTARLERCLVEHLDCCHYRLDAWLLSVLHAQLDAMRSAGQQEGSRRGIYLGAFGWVENVKSDLRQLEAAPLDDVQRETFDPDGTAGIVTDSRNGGHLHAPSVAHGLTAAVLRNAYISAASADDADHYRINLSSERVRMALAIIEGMQQGQGLAELLGYRLERGLHDHNTEELDIFVHELRKVFPLASNRLRRTAIRRGRIARNALESARFAEEEEELDGDRAVTKVEARNVINGLALLDHIEDTGNASYPFGFPIGSGAGHLRDGTPGERAAIDAEVRLLMNVRDAVADLALAEGVHQVVQGNIDRAAGALDTYSKGAFPQSPDVVRTPVSGTTLTHRFAIHLPAGLAPATGLTPRAKAEPGLAAWLRDLFPPTDRIACTLRFRTPAAPEQPPNPWTDFPVTLQDLGLEPVDLLYLHDQQSEKDLGALDDHVLRVFRAAAPRRPDLEIEIAYTEAPGDDATFFEVGALLADLRRLVLAARPVAPADIALQDEAAKADNVHAAVDPARISAALAIHDAALTALQADVIAVLEPLVDDEDVEVGVGNIGAIVAAIDAVSDAFVAHMGTLSLFGSPGTGSGFVHDRKRAITVALRERVRAYDERWDDFVARYDALIGIDLPAAGTDEERIAVLQRAEALVSTSFTTDFADVAALQAAVATKRGQFDTRHAAIAAFPDAAFLTLSAQHAAAAALVAGLDAFDPEPLSLAEDERRFVVLAEDMLKQAQSLHTAGDAVRTEVQDLIADAATATPADRLSAMRDAAKLLFGEGFRLFPEFSLAAARAQELQHCLADQAQLLSHQRDTLGRDFPVDEWLYGVARVREKLAAWENVVVLAEGLRPRPPLELTPIQLPYRGSDTWLALEYPDTHVIEGDTMLYTAYAPGLDPTAVLAGVLVDEWTETIPAREETTALTFHYDRPNCEAPQTLLLVTPASATGSWVWRDVVASLHEALELARLRAVEPDQLDQLDYARFLPATVATLTVHPVTIALNYATFAMAVSDA